MYERTRFGTTPHSQKVVQDSDAYVWSSADGKGKAPPSVWRMWLVALRFCGAMRGSMPSLHSETSNKSTHREPSVLRKLAVRYHESAR
jgi:hypothetical protein